jgi:hypothetical protein
MKPVPPVTRVLATTGLNTVVHRRSW